MSDPKFGGKASAQNKVCNTLCSNLIQGVHECGEKYQSMY